MTIEIKYLHMHLLLFSRRSTCRLNRFFIKKYKCRNTLDIKQQGKRKKKEMRIK